MFYLEVHDLEPPQLEVRDLEVDVLLFESQFHCNVRLMHCKIMTMKNRIHYCSKDEIICRG
jgi:hypothetical protein